MLTTQKMHLYAEDGHDTGISAYRFNKNSITVLFREGWYYLYDNGTPGKHHVDAMKALAKHGRGLSTYISQHVRENYRRKWRED